MAKDSVVVIGDVMIDRTWVLDRESVSASSKSRTHFGVRPRTMKDPETHTDVLGAAGAVARWLLSMEHNVLLCGAWSDSTQRSLTGDEEAVFGKVQNARAKCPLLPEWDGSAHLEIARVASSRHDIVKWRLYETNDQGRHELALRFDRDPSGDVKREGLNEVVVPKLGTPKVVIVNDFDKGLLRHDAIRREIARLGEDVDAKLLLRAKRRSTVDEIPWALWLCSCEELFAYAFDDPPPPPFKALEKVQDGFRLHPDIVAALTNVWRKSQKSGKSKKSKKSNAARRHIYVQLELEGGLLCSDDGVAAHVIQDWLRRAPGVSARDCFLAHVASTLIEGSNIADCVREGLVASTAYSGRGDEVVAEGHEGGRWFVPANIPAGGEWKSVLERAKPWVENFAARPLVDLAPGDPLASAKCVWLADADFYLPGYSTIVAHHGRQVAKLAFDVSLARRAARDSKPLVVAIAGEPGCGKSFLVKALADANEDAFGAPTSGKPRALDLIEERVDTWESVQDLVDLCERVRTKSLEGRMALVFLDEIDSRAFHGDHVYSRLLGPLGDGAYYRRGNKHVLGNAVFVLAGSTPEWINAVSDMTKAEGKLRDLLSRVSQRLSIPGLKGRQCDGAYVALRIRDQLGRRGSVKRSELRQLVEKCVDMRELVRKAKRLAESDTASEEFKVIA